MNSTGSRPKEIFLQTQFVLGVHGNLQERRQRDLGYKKSCAKRRDLALIALVLCRLTLKSNTKRSHNGLTNSLMMVVVMGHPFG